MTYYLQAYNISVVIVYTAVKTEFRSILRISTAKTKYTRFKNSFTPLNNINRTPLTVYDIKKQPNEL